MANSYGTQIALSQFPLFLILAIVTISTNIPLSFAQSSRNLTMNPIDKCWRWDPNWRNDRKQLATCSVGYTGKMTNNIGTDVTFYEVIDPKDEAINPQPGTLRYGLTKIKGKVWITFQRNMHIKLQGPLLLSSFTVIDGRGANVHIGGVGCFILRKVSNVIIHNLRIHDCRAKESVSVMGPGGQVVNVGTVDADAIRMISCSKIWIDHNTLYSCKDGLIDVTRGSTNITISNNWFRKQDKVMLLGHDDGYLRDKNMKVTVAFNHFGPGCHQRMPRIRHGYAHVVNNLYQGWGLYAIGGSMNPSVKSQANLYIASDSGNKEITWKNGDNEKSVMWNFRSVEDAFENGARFDQAGGGMKPNYTPEQIFRVGNAKSVRTLTQDSGTLKCTKTSRC